MVETGTRKAVRGLTIKQRPLDPLLPLLRRLFLKLDEIDLCCTSTTTSCREIGRESSSVVVREDGLVEVGDAEGDVQGAGEGGDCEVVGFLRDGLRAAVVHAVSASSGIQT